MEEKFGIRALPSRGMEVKSPEKQWVPGRRLGCPGSPMVEDDCSKRHLAKAVRGPVPIPVMDHPWAWWKDVFSHAASPGSTRQAGG